VLGALGSGQSNPASGTVFALQQSVLSSENTATAININADTAANNGGATMTYNNSGAPPFLTVQLKVPGLGIDVPVTVNSLAGSQLPNGNLAFVRFQGNSGMSYTAPGIWAIVNSTGTQAFDTGYFVTGLRTPVAAMPTSGSAAYAGTGNVVGNALIQGASIGNPNAVVSTKSVNLAGDGQVTANFATGALSGTFTNIQATQGGTTLPWNALSLSGTISGANVSGTTAITSSPGNATALTASGSGVFSGGFFGPAAVELGIVWSVRDSNGSVGIGTFGGVSVP
jgi:C-lobe and N-lobe beta barrels of Tf-binding protein B